MNKIDQTLNTLKSLDYKTPVRRCYINKLTARDLILFDKKIKEGYFLPDIHLHHEDKKCKTLGYTILSYLYSQEEIIKWFKNCLNSYSKNRKALEIKKTEPKKIYQKILGLNNISVDLKFPEIIDRKIFQSLVHEFLEQSPFPENLVILFNQTIQKREPLTKAIKEFRKVFSAHSKNSIDKIMNQDIMKIYGMEELENYFKDMIKQFRTKYSIDPEEVINNRSLGFFLTGSINLLSLDKIASTLNSSSNWRLAYLRAALPELITDFKIDRFRLYHLLKLEKEAVQFWEERYFQKVSKRRVKKTVNFSEDFRTDLTEKELTEIKRLIKSLVTEYKTQRVIPTRSAILKIYKEKSRELELIPENFPILSLVKKLIQEEIEQLKEYYFKTRKECIDPNSDCWLYYISDQGRIQASRIDFTLIKSDKLKTELKQVLSYFISNDLSTRDLRNLINNCSRLEDSQNITSFSEITAQKLRVLYHDLLFTKELTPRTVSHVNTLFAKAFEILIKEKSNNLYNNEARNIKFYNLQAHTKNPEIIPDEVLKEINRYLDELPEDDQLIFRLFMITGWRFSEVIQLRPEDFRKVEGYPDLIEVDNTNTKTASARKKKGYTLHQSDFIPATLYHQLENYLKRTSQDRKAYQIKTCFYSIDNNRALPVISRYFNRDINRLIKKHNIIDKQGNLWHFSSKQTRRKVAVDLIKQGVPLNVVQQKLGHLHTKTTQTYYTATQKIEMAEINADYFKSSIQSHLNSQKNNTELSKFCEDFKGILQLEHGICKKPLCSHLSKTGCSNCSKLCTGNLYIQEWERLLESINLLVKNLESFYRIKGIEPEEYIKDKAYQNLTRKQLQLSEVVNELSGKK